MPGLSESFFANKSFTLVAAALAFLGAAILISLIFRLVFGGKLRLPRNGRARLPRLGTVDAFDLDRQRQLVIIRRDNVEHLLMIGGPNDLVIESQIIRAESREPRDFRDARLREKELREKEARDTAALPASVSWPAPAESPSSIPPQRKPSFPPATVLEPETAGMTGGRAEEPRPSAFPMPPRRVSSPAAPSSQRILNHREPLSGRVESPPRPDSTANPAKDFRRASVATPFLRSSPNRLTETPAVRLAPSGGFEVPAPAGPPHGIEESPALPEINIVAEARAAAPAPSTAVAEAPDFTADDLIADVPVAETTHADIDTLETEMAKLLGRRPASGRRRDPAAVQTTGLPSCCNERRGGLFCLRFTASRVQVSR
jgi:flagellar protein FliO/FliZ